MCVRRVVVGLRKFLTAAFVPSAAGRRLVLFARRPRGDIWRRLFRENLSRETGRIGVYRKTNKKTRAPSEHARTRNVRKIILSLVKQYIRIGKRCFAYECVMNMVRVGSR